MDQYSIVETRPLNRVILMGMFILLLCAAGASAVYYTKSNLLEVELVNERHRLLKVTQKVDYLESRAEMMQHNYVDLILTGYMRVGPRDMRDLVQEAKSLRTVSNQKPKGPEMVGIGGGEESVRQPKKVKTPKKGRKSRRK